VCFVLYMWNFTTQNTGLVSVFVFWLVPFFWSVTCLLKTHQLGTWLKMYSVVSLCYALYCFNMHTRLLFFCVFDNSVLCFLLFPFCWSHRTCHAPSSRHLRALLSVCGGCSLGGLGRCSCRVCVCRCRGCCSLTVCVCVWPVDLFTRTRLCFSSWTSAILLLKTHKLGTCLCFIFCAFHFLECNFCTQNTQAGHLTQTI